MDLFIHDAQSVIQMTLTILQISDLHRDPLNPISNNSLLDSLERDRERYRNEDASVALLHLLNPIRMNRLLFGDDLKWLCGTRIFPEASVRLAP